MELQPLAAAYITGRKEKHLFFLFPCLLQIKGSHPCNQGYPLTMSRRKIFWLTSPHYVTSSKDFLNKDVYVRRVQSVRKLIYLRDWWEPWDSLNELTLCWPPLLNYLGRIGHQWPVESFTGGPDSRSLLHGSNHTYKWTLFTKLTHTRCLYPFLLRRSKKGLWKVGLAYMEPSWRQDEGTELIKVTTTPLRLSLGGWKTFY